MTKKVWQAGEEITAAALNHTDMGLKALAQSSPDMTLAVDPGMIKFDVATMLKYAGGNSSAFTAPSSNPRIDILTITSGGSLGITQGSEAASPSAPTYPTDKFVICEVYLRVGSTSIKNIDDGSNAYIYKDARPFNCHIGIIYGASSTGDDTYTLSAPLSAYVTGMSVFLKPDTGNTGAATLNINSLGAKTIKKISGGSLVDLDDGDIEAGQIVHLVYDGTYFQYINFKGIKRANGSTYVNVSTSATPVTKTIAHGLGKAPKKIRVVTMGDNPGNYAMPSMCWGNWDASGANSVCVWYYNGMQRASYNAYLILTHSNASDNASAYCTVSVDATNITLTFPQAGGNFTIYFTWEAEA